MFKLSVRLFKDAQCIMILSNKIDQEEELHMTILLGSLIIAPFILAVGAALVSSELEVANQQ